MQTRAFTSNGPAPAELPATGAARPWSESGSVRRALWALVVIALGFTLYLTSSLLLPIMVAGTLALLLSPAVGALNKLHLPQPVSAGIIMLIVLAALGAMTVNLAAPIQRWIDIAPKELRRLEHEISRLMRPVEVVREATEKVTEIATNKTNGKQREVVVERKPMSAMLDVTVNTMVTVLSTVMLLYFLLASGDLLLRKLVMVTPDREGKVRMLGILRTIQREVGRYFATITLGNIGLGIASALALWALDMPTPAVWGVAITLLNFLPYLGPLIATLLLAAVAVLTFDNLFAVLAPPGAFLLLNFIEDQFVMPFVLGRRLSINPVVIFVWVLFWAWMWGVGGLLLAVPLLVAVRICAERVPFLNPIAVVLARA